ncbi:MAG: membrane protein insertase YidC [Actinomycetota bacterium]
MFEIPAAILSWFYGLTNSYIVAIALIAALVMAITTPLTLKSTKGMLEMQKLAPEMRKLQNEYRSDRQKLNEEMMKLYQEHKVNPLSSCLPLLAQAPVFYIMFRILRGLIYTPRGAAGPVAERVWLAFDNPGEAADPGFIPRYLSTDSDLYLSLFGERDMVSLGLDLSRSALEAVADGFGGGIIYVLLVVLLGGLYFVQQRMVAARASVSPTMSPAQQKIMQYLPVVFAVFQVFFLAALVVYYIFQTLMRIAQQAYITRRFYGHDESLGRQAQRAGEEAREHAKKNGEGGGLFAQAKRDLAAARGGDGDNGAGSNGSGSKNTPAKKSTASKRVTPPKNKPTPSAGSKGRPTPTRKQANEKKRASRPKSSSKRRRGS